MSGRAGPLPARARLHAVIVRRPRVSTITGLLLALAFALVVTPIVLAEAWAIDARVAPGQVAAVTVRLGADDVSHVAGARRTGGVIIARGEVATAAQAEAVAVAAAATPRGATGFVTYGLVLFALAAGFTHHLKRSNRGRLLRVQLVLLGTIAVGAIVTKALLLAYPLSVLAVPVALGAIVPTLVFDRTVGLATGVLAALVMSLLVPFDVGVVTVLVLQALSATVVIPERPRARWSLALGAGLVALVGAALAYVGFAYLSARVWPFDELATPASSSFAAACVGGAMAGVLAMPLLPLFELACGEITWGRLVALEDLSHPMLKQIAEKAPGTWQHSLAMANLAEVAANAIGASGRLVRVGAYFHDLGKSLQPTYFIENLAPGEPSPHDQLAPEVSCDAIFAHVTEGIVVARRHKLPERIIDFMHMHHGDGVLEYFWAKCQDQGNPRGLTIDDFRYPGVPPQSRETAILAICDAVEAASRTLKRPDARSVESLVQRIVYGKLHLGQLDESGLSMADLRRISDSLREAIRHAHHGRIEYPWQREAQAEAAAATAPTGPAPALVAPGDRSAATQRLMSEPRLDSLDVPRPLQWDDRGREAGLGAAAVVTPPSGTTAPTARRATDPAAFHDTIDLAIATTAGLGASAAAAPTAPIPTASVGPTADALADAVINALGGDEASSSGRRAPSTLPPPSVQRPPAPATTPPALAAKVTAPPPALAPTPIAPSEVARAALDGGWPGLEERVRPRAERTTEPIVLEPLEERARRAPRAPTAPLDGEGDGAPVETTLPAWRGPAPADEVAGDVAGEVAGDVADEVAGDAPDDVAIDAAASDDVPVPAFHPAASATFEVPRPTARTPAAAEPPAEAGDDDEPEIEVAVPADDAVVDEQPSSVPPPPPASASEWVGRLSARIDAMLGDDDEPDDDDDAAPASPAAAPFGGDTVRRMPPVPPRTRPIPRVTQPIEVDDVEATLELSPSASRDPAGVFVGPPPITRVRTQQVPRIPAPPPPPAPAPTDEDDDGPSVVGPRPSGSMLPPRARRGPDS